jgi:hypothetical protein
MDIPLIVPGEYPAAGTDKLAEFRSCGNLRMIYPACAAAYPAYSPSVPEPAVRPHHRRVKPVKRDYAAVDARPAQEPPGRSARRLLQCDEKIS